MASRSPALAGQAWSPAEGRGAVSTASLAPEQPQKRPPGTGHAAPRDAEHGAAAGLLFPDPSLLLLSHLEELSNHSFSFFCG